MKTKRFLTLAGTLVLALPLTVSWAVRRGAARVIEGEAIAIRGGTIVTVSGSPIPRGTVVIRGGLITAVGADVPVPADARVIDATGMTVYPGLIDSYTTLGLETTAAATTGGRGGGAPATPAVPVAIRRGDATTPAGAPTPTPTPAGQSPELMAADQLKVTADTFDAQRGAGITSALTAPRDGLFQGQSAFINLGGEEAEKLIVKSPVTLNIGFQPGRTGGYPGSLMGGFAFLRQSMLDAQYYRELWSRYERNKRGMERPKMDKSLAALQPVITGALPVVLQANSAREIRRAILFAEEFKLKYLIAGAAQSYEVAELLKQKNVPVLLSLNYPQRPTNIEDPESEALRTLKERAEAPKAALALFKAGVRFAFQSGNLTRPQDFILNAARAIEAGLPKEEALKALTLNSAEILGVAEQLGSLEAGKIADVVVASGDIFDRRTQIKYVFIDGRQYEVKPPAVQAGFGSGGRGPGGRGAGPGLPLAVTGSGVWIVKANSPAGPLDMTLDLQQQGIALSGRVTSQFGTATITDGQINGNELTINYTAEVQGNKTPISARATIEGNSIRGTFTIFGQQIEFSGTRAPRQ